MRIIRVISVDNGVRHLLVYHLDVPGDADREEERHQEAVDYVQSRAGKLVVCQNHSHIRIRRRNFRKNRKLTHRAGKTANCVPHTAASDAENVMHQGLLK